MLEVIQRSLRTGGTYPMGDVRAATSLQDNIGQPLAPYLFLWSFATVVRVPKRAGDPEGIMAVESTAPRRMIDPVAAASAVVAPGPRGNFLLGHIPDMTRDQLGFLLSCARTYGDFVQIKLGRRPVILLSHPRDVEEVLVTRQRNFAKGYFYRLLGPLLGNGLLTSEGEFWLRQRRLAQPAFHQQRISAYAQTMVDYTQGMLRGWRDGERRDIHADMMRLTLQIVGKTLFGTDIQADAD